MKTTIEIVLALVGLALSIKTLFEDESLKHSLKFNLRTQERLVRRAGTGW